MSVAQPPPKDLDELLLRLDHWAAHFDTPMAKDCGFAAEELRRLERDLDNCKHDRDG